MIEKDFWKLFGGGQKVTETTNDVHVGALVSISENASFWDGERVEDWWRRRNWYVTELNGNKAKLGRDESGKYKMHVPISTNYLTVIQKAEENVSEVKQND